MPGTRGVTVHRPATKLRVIRVSRRTVNGRSLVRFSLRRTTSKSFGAEFFRCQFTYSQAYFGRWSVYTRVRTSLNTCGRKSRGRGHTQATAMVVHKLAQHQC